MDHLPDTVRRDRQTRQAGWVVPDIDAAMRDLRAKGVIFEDYAMGDEGPTTENGVPPHPTGGAAAWFIDSEGNVLALTQLPPGMALSGDVTSSRIQGFGGEVIRAGPRGLRHASLDLERHGHSAARAHRAVHASVDDVVAAVRHGPGGPASNTGVRSGGDGVLGLSVSRTGA